MCNIKVNMKQLQHKLNTGLWFRLFILVIVRYNEVISLNRMDPTWFATMQSPAHYSNATVCGQLVHNNVLLLH